MDTENKKKVTKAISGAAKLRKRTWVRTMRSIATSEEVRDVADHVVNGIVKPMLKDALYAAVQDTMTSVLYGTNNTGKRPVGARVSYNQYYQRPVATATNSAPIAKANTASFDLGDIVLETRKDADAVMDALYDTVGSYGFVTVNDLYDMVEKTAPYTSNDYGWTKAALDRASAPSRTRDGYVLNLPKPRALDAI